MKIDFSQQLKNLDGSSIDGLTLKSVAISALHAVLPGDEHLPQGRKYERGKLAQQIHATNGQAVEIPIEQLADLKLAIERTYGPLVVVQALDMIEGK